MKARDDGTRPLRILVAEDDDAMRDLLVVWLRDAGYDVTACSDGFDLKTRLQMSVLSEELAAFDLVVSDIRLPLGSALEILDEFLGCDGIPPTILLTAFGSRHTLQAASRLGAARVLDKPFDKGRLLAEIQGLQAARTGPGAAAARPAPA